MHKDFTLAHYYHQLERCEADLHILKCSRGNGSHSRTSSPNLRVIKKHSSTSSFSREQTSKGNYREFNKNRLEKVKKNKLKATLKPNHQRITVPQRESMIDDMDCLENAWKFSKEVARQKYNGSENEDWQKTLGEGAQKSFTRACREMYGLTGDYAVISRIEKEIDLRDAIYEAVRGNMKRLGKSGESAQIFSELQDFFQEFSLMRRIIQEFKRISKLNIKNTQQLYYFLVQDEEQGHNGAEKRQDAIKDAINKVEEQLEIKNEIQQ